VQRHVCKCTSTPSTQLFTLSPSSDKINSHSASPALPLQNQQLTTKLCVTSLPPCLFDHTPPGVFDGQGSGHDFYGVSILSLSLSL
jgi:hypothetical protein